MRFYTCYLIFVSFLYFSSCTPEEEVVLPAFTGYGSYFDCPEDVIGTLNGYRFSAFATLEPKSNYPPKDHFVLIISNFTSGGSLRYDMIFQLKADTQSIGRECQLLDFRKIEKRPSGYYDLPIGKVSMIVSLNTRGGDTPPTVSYELDETNNEEAFLIFDSVDWVDGNPEAQGGMWYGRIKVKLKLLASERNDEAYSQAIQLGEEIPTHLDFDLDFSAPTAIGLWDENCGR